MLELCNFKVKDVRFGSQTRWQDGLLELAHDEVLELVCQDPFVAKAEVEVARPGESVRIVTLRDVIEPRVKVEGEGMAYPGVHGRSPATVGHGRTHRLGGMTLMACAPPLSMQAYGLQSTLDELGSNAFVDMSGPGADSPYSSLNNVCLIVEPSADLDPEQGNRVVQKAMLRVADLLAKTTIGLEPTDTEILDLTPKAGLPGYVYIHCPLSPEALTMNPDSTLGTAVYGITRLTQPWLLRPTEILDGAVFGAFAGWMTWPMTNTIVPHMCRCHGTNFNFLGCIIVRTQWEEQWQKELMADRAAQIASMLGADGAVLTPTCRGQRFVETILTVQACERIGVKTVLITEEENDENGTAPPLLVTAPEVVAVVSTGNGSSPGPFPPVEKIIGAGQISEKWYREQEPIIGRYDTSHLNDVWGFGRQSCMAY